METALAQLQREASSAIARAFGSTLAPEETEADLSPCAQEGFGHYQCNSALRLSKSLKQNPRAIAQKIIDSLDSKFATSFSTIDIAGPGFINFTLSPSFLSKQLQEMLQDPLLGTPRPSMR